jgi:hypothetical protein
MKGFDTSISIKHATSSVPLCKKYLIELLMLVKMCTIEKHNTRHAITSDRCRIVSIAASENSWKALDGVGWAYDLTHVSIRQSKDSECMVY